jgi:hypothetical protein
MFGMIPNIPIRIIGSEPIYAYHPKTHNFYTFSQKKECHRLKFAWKFLRIYKEAKRRRDDETTKTTKTRRRRHPSSKETKIATRTRTRSF